LAAFAENFPRALKAHLDNVPETTPIAIWFQGEARIGQKNGLVRQCARRGTRPRQPADQHYALALPYADIDMMQLHLDEISRNGAHGAHAALLLDRAGCIRPVSSVCPKTSPRSSCPHAPRTQEQLADPPFDTEKLDSLMLGSSPTMALRSSAMLDDC